MPPRAVHVLKGRAGRTGAEGAADCCVVPEHGGFASPEGEAGVRGLWLWGRHALLLLVARGRQVARTAIRSAAGETAWLDVSGEAGAFALQERLLLPLSQGIPSSGAHSLILRQTGVNLEIGGVLLPMGLTAVVSGVSLPDPRASSRLGERLGSSGNLLTGTGGNLPELRTQARTPRGGTCYPPVASSRREGRSRHVRGIPSSGSSSLTMLFLGVNTVAWVPALSALLRWRCC